MQEAMTTQRPKHKTKPRPLTPKQEQIINTRKQHPELSTREIGKVCNADNGYISRVLQQYGLNHQSAKDYSEHEADIWRGITSKFLSNISTEDIQKESAYRKITGAAIAFDKLHSMIGDTKTVQPMVQIVQVKVEQRPDQDQILTLESNQFKSSTVIENTTTNDINNLGD